MGRIIAIANQKGGTIFAYLHIVRHCFIMPPLEKADRICEIQSIIS